MKEKTLKEGVLPVVQETNCVLIGLTTPGSSNSAMHRLLNTKDDDGQPIITTIRIGKPCDDCIKAQILCYHNKDATPEGTSKKKRQRFANIYKSDPTTYLKEYGGVPGDDDNNLFKHEWLMRLAENPLKPVTGPIDMIMLTFDPAQGGRCEWGSCACYYDLAGAGTQVIIHLDMYKLQSHDPKPLTNMLLTTILSIRRSHPQFYHVPIVVACEAAPRVISTQLNGYLKDLIKANRVGNVIMMTELDSNGIAEAGVPKTHKNSQLMVKYTQDLFSTNRIAFSEALSAPLSLKTRQEITCIYLDQMHGLHIDTKINPETGKAINRITGKGHGMNDDLGVAIIMNPYWYEYFHLNTANKVYESIKKQSRTWRGERFVRFFHAATEQANYIPYQEQQHPTSSSSSSSSLYIP